MTIFVIFRVHNAARMEAALATTFPDNHLKVAPNEWIVSATGTASEISAKIGIPQTPELTAMVFSMANYHGRASTEIWEWIKTKAEQPSG